MPVCQKCWSDAHSCDDVSARYYELIVKRQRNPCTPEEQAGREAETCPKCKRKTMHEITNQCMNCSFQN